MAKKDSHAEKASDTLKKNAFFMANRPQLGFLGGQNESKRGKNGPK
jgi:hypothetical protein